MSATTTDNARLNTLRHHLADYELHHSQPSEAEAASAPPPSSQPGVTAASNPEGWETQWRRVPAYRPARPENLLGDRNTFNNEIERNFIRVMFGGVTLQARASWLWRSTGGRLNDQIFRVRIGGEW
ncbi:Hypothetical predicted protein [Lecanosticta acicola]|uniref:Uncharacterized protein n=1 Tax=Lecanosticta acicola TaxID=111012 RepID=A0AAI8Z8V1_9PEZI|nr:Hypothetical predicted protein [Lecanosticta acicola]